MDLSRTIFEINGQAMTLFDLLPLAGLTAFLLLIATMVLAWRAASSRKRDADDAVRRAGELELRLAEMSGQLRQFAETVTVRDQHMATRLDERLEQVSQRLGRGLAEQTDRTGQSLQQLNERLAVIDRAQANLAQLSSEMVSLKDILANKQARGAFGQARMEAIVRDGLDASAYKFQATLSNGTRPDCLVRLPDNELGIVIDAKFPLEAFNALKSASEDGERLQAAQRVRNDVGKHVRDIATKYLIAGETHETAVMFVPSESLYADLYEHFEDVVQKAHRSRVVFASPNILMLLIQTMQAVFKDARMREQAGLIQTEVSRLLEDVDRLRNRVSDLQRHFGMANQDIEKLMVSSQKIARRGQRIEEMDFTDQNKVEGDESRPSLMAGE